MSAEQDDDLKKFYRRRIDEHNLTYEAMWGDTASWKSHERFKPLLSLPIKPGDVLVDIGCGIGDLAAVLKDGGIRCSYIGVEAVPEFAEQARKVTNSTVLEIDAFRDLSALPEADWYVTFGTINKSWNIANLPGDDDEARIQSLFQHLFTSARKGFAASLVTDLVAYRKEGVVNMDPGKVMSHLRQLTPNFTIFHGYPFYEFFAAAWRGERL